MYVCVYKIIYSAIFCIKNRYLYIYMKTNQSVENIGARRLHTVIERVMEEISFDAPDKSGEKVEITDEYVKKRVSDLLLTSDLRKYIL